MNRLDTIAKYVKYSSLALVAAATVATAAPARADSCQRAAAGRQFVCESTSQELRQFTVEFGDNHRVAGVFGGAMDCFCSSTGTVARPRIEGGPGITCVATLSADDAIVLNARFQGNRILQGTVAVIRPDGPFTDPFVCTPVQK